MKNTLKKLLKGINGIKNIPEIPISGISTNSALIKPGNLYIAIKGNRYFFSGTEILQKGINTKTQYPSSLLQTKLEAQKH